MTTELQKFLTARDFLAAQRTNYQAAIDGFIWPQLTHFNWALDYFDVIAHNNDAPALHIVEENGDEAKLSYAQLSQRSSQVANYLHSVGVRRGHRLLLMLGNEVPLWETMLAAIKLGAVLVPATNLLSGRDLADRIERGQIKHIVTSAIGMARINELPAEQIMGINRIAALGQGGGVALPAGWLDFHESRNSVIAYTPSDSNSVHDPLIEYFTSGTTSKPKLVRHTQQSYPVGHLATMYWLGMQRGDTHWTISSPGWGKHAWSCFFSPFNAQACVFIYNYARFSGPAVLQTLIKFKVTSLCAPPTVWRLMILEDLKSWKVPLREVISAGEPLNPEVIERVRDAWGLTIRDGYGQTETTAMLGNSPGNTVVPGSMGRPTPGYKIVLLDADDQPADEGEICIDLSQRPLALMDGYADDDAKTAEAMRNGYYHTGDVGARDAQGYVTYVGRADDVFKASGYRISPFELESALIEHAAVAEAAVVPSPDPVRGFVPKAYVIVAPGHEPTAATAAAIFKFLKERVSPYKMIRRIEFADLPKTISGKIRRVELRGLESQRPASGAINEREFLEEQFR